MAVRQTREWQERAERLVGDLERWNGAREASAQDFFDQKALMFTDLLLLIPSNALRTRALRSFVGFLRHSDVERDRRSLWFVFVTRLLELARGADRQLVLETMESAGHPVLALYAKLERFGGQTP